MAKTNNQNDYSVSANIRGFATDISSLMPKSLNKLEKLRQLYSITKTSTNIRELTDAILRGDLENLIGVMQGSQKLGFLHFGEFLRTSSLEGLVQESKNGGNLSDEEAVRRAFKLLKGIDFSIHKKFAKNGYEINRVELELSSEFRKTQTYRMAKLLELYEVQNQSDSVVVSKASASVARLLLIMMDTKASVKLQEALADISIDMVRKHYKQLNRSIPAGLISKIKSANGKQVMMSIFRTRVLEDFSTQILSSISADLSQAKPMKLDIDLFVLLGEVDPACGINKDIPVQIPSGEEYRKRFEHNVNKQLQELGKAKQEFQYFELERLMKDQQVARNPHANRPGLYSLQNGGNEYRQNNSQLGAHFQTDPLLRMGMANQGGLNGHGLAYNQENTHVIPNLSQSPYRHVQSGNSFPDRMDQRLLHQQNQYLRNYARNNMPFTHNRASQDSINPAFTISGITTV